MLDLKDKVVLVTGAASGLGASLAPALLEAGARVALLDRQSQRLREVCERIDPSGQGTLALDVDLLDRACLARALDEVHRRFGALDVLVNNAGTDVTASMSELSFEDWDRVIQTNLTVPFQLTKLALPMLTASRGQVVNVASTASLRAWPNATAYHASKWGLHGLSHAMHAELRDVGVRVMCVIVGGMRTPFLTERFEGLDMTRLQDPANVARAVTFALTMPPESAVPELMVLPRLESSWP